MFTWPGQILFSFFCSLSFVQVNNNFLSVGNAKEITVISAHLCYLHTKKENYLLKDIGSLGFFFFFEIQTFIFIDFVKGTKDAILNPGYMWIESVCSFLYTSSLMLAYFFISSHIPLGDL